MISNFKYKIKVKSQTKSRTNLPMNLEISMSRASRHPRRNFLKPVKSELLVRDWPSTVSTMSSIICGRRFSFIWSKLKVDSLSHLEIFGKFFLQHQFIVFNEVRAVEFCLYFWFGVRHKDWQNSWK